MPTPTSTKQPNGATFLTTACSNVSPARTSESVAGAPATLSDVRAGETFEHAVVKNVAPFGCFVDVGVGTDGLLHSSELRAHGGTLEVEARVRVVVKSVDVERGRLGLALAPA